MKNFINSLKNKIFNGENITYEEAKKILEIDNSDTELIEELCQKADEIREKFCGDYFDLCTILNAKSGLCSENCKYCAQSAHFKTAADVYPLVSKERALEEAKKVEDEGAHRFSLVTSGRGLTINDKEVNKLEEIYRYLKENTELSLCASHGICDVASLEKLKNAGVTTYHHNLETSPNYYSKICTTHTYEDRINTVKNAYKAGLKVCSGGIWGLGESNIDRLDMAFELRKLDVFSVPINILMPIEGTPLENNREIEPIEILKTMAVYRFILPKAFLRYAGGRVKLKDYQEKGIKSGINSALTGNFLTTTGTTIQSDKEMIVKNGYKIR